MPTKTDKKEIHFKCRKCGDEIYWNTHKSMTYCKCSALGVDGCEYYVRLIGDEAKKVYSLSDSELLSQGWKLRIDSGFDPLPWSISFNFIFYLAISRGLIFIVERVKQRGHEASEF